MPNLNPCPMPTCGAPIDAVHLVPQGMGAFTYVIRCDCGLTFDTGAQSEAAAAERWNERPALAGETKPVELTVWYGPMPESNGKTNWTALLHRKGDLYSGITIDRSEHPDRVRYEADRMRFMIGELSEEPDILAYDSEKHSGYTRPAPAGVVLPESQWGGPFQDGWNACLDAVANLNGAPK